MKITTLAENSPDEGCSLLRAEHGLSLYVERGDGARLLFDVGSSARFSVNAELLGVDLSVARCLVLSHHHRDHGGGLDVFCRRNDHAPVYLRRGEATALFAHDLGGDWRSIGIRSSILRRYATRLHLVEGETTPLPGVFLLTDIPRRHPTSPSNRRLYMQREGERCLDDFSHELVMVIREPTGLVVFTGCSHLGVRNMLDAVTQRFSGEKIVAVIGGFHLPDVREHDPLFDLPQDIDALGEALLAASSQKFYTGHCTGHRAFERLKKIMGDKLERLHTGKIISL